MSFVYHQHFSHNLLQHILTITSQMEPLHITVIDMPNLFYECYLVIILPVYLKHSDLVRFILSCITHKLTCSVAFILDYCIIIILTSKHVKQPSWSHPNTYAHAHHHVISISPYMFHHYMYACKLFLPVNMLSYVMALHFKTHLFVFYTCIYFFWYNKMKSYIVLVHVTACNI